jgi:hypothetical protein
MYPLRPNFFINIESITRMKYNELIGQYEVYFGSGVEIVTAEEWNKIMRMLIP